MPLRLRLFILAMIAFAPGALPALDKNGVAPQAISLPSGPGSIQGLGESFQPQLNTGSGSYAVKLPLPRGTGGMTPELGLAYNSGAGNGPLGLGWSLSGLPRIRRNTDRGVPLYVDGPDGIDDDLDGVADNPEELDTYTGAGEEELVPLADGSFRAENEGGFVRYRRAGAGWEAHPPDGRRLHFGQSPQARVEDGGRVFEWCLERIADRNSNAIDFEYLPDPAAPAQKHLARIRWGRPEASFAVVLRYQAGRPDVFQSFRSGFELRTSLRLVEISVVSQGMPAPAFALRGDFDGDSKDDALIRRWRLEYDAEAHLSLLCRVTQLGADGATALPALSLSYGRWTPIDDAAAALIRSRDAPSPGFESGSVELIDMNGDGLPDLLSTTASQHRLHMNLGVGADGRLAWAPGRPVGGAPPVDLASERVHLADATSDGLADLLLKASNTSFICYQNTGENGWRMSPFPLRNTDTWPIWPFEGTGGGEARSIDCDYSRSNDVLHTSQSGNRLWMLLPGGRYARELRLPPLIADGQVFRFDLPGTRIADLNGDRLQDLAWIQANRVVYFPSRGRGSFGEPVTLELGRTLSAADVEKSGFSDVDGDGLVDLTVVRPAGLGDGLLYWLNRFERGLEGPRTLRGLPAQRAGDALRWADMNGNGTTDIVIAQEVTAPGEKVLVIELVPDGKVHLLERIENGLGLRVTLGYESSTAQMARAASAGSPWEARMPIAVTVVSRIAEEDGLSPVHEQALTYRDPYYDPVKQEFRGFAGAEADEAGDASAAGKRTRHVFDTGRAAPCLKGKTLAQDLLGEDGKLFRRTVSAWGQRVLAAGVDGRQVCFAFEEAVDELIHEGEAEGIRLRTETDYDDHGNAVAERRHGVLAEGGDEVFVEREFDLRLPDWLLRLPARETTWEGGGRRAAEQRFFHDARGNLERVESWLDAEDRRVTVLRRRFDAFGNVIETTDARGSRRSTAYDPLVHAWPVSESIHLAQRDLVMTAEYDLGFGVVMAGVDFHGQRSDLSYDALGRPVEILRPGGAGKRFEYHPASPVSRVVERLLEDAAGATFDSHAYFDGYGRPLGTKIEAEGGRWRFLGAKAYNARKLEARAWLPHSSDTPEYAPPDPALAHEQRFYDAPGRVVQTIQADGAVTRTEHHPLAEAVFDGNDTEGRGGPDVRRRDGLGRPVSVEERNGDESYLTRYRWNARGELQEVIDALGNVKRFRFDSLGRLVEVDDPDRGLLRFAYDDASNRVGREDARGQVIAYGYDAANRTLEKVYRGAGAGGPDVVEAVYHYDAAAGELDFGDGTRGGARNVLGRLAWVEDSSGEEHFSYDERGNIEWVLKRILDPATGLLVAYRTQRRHDLMDREAEIVFPDNDRLRFLRGEGSFVERIDGGPEGAVILAEGDYAASGQPLRLRFGNGAESTFEYDSGQRLQRLRATDAGGAEVLHQSLAYDLASNVIAVDDERPLTLLAADSPRRATARYAYDELHRLTRVGYGVDESGGRIDYAHDALGNLLSQSTPPAGSPGHLGDPAPILGALSYRGGRGAREGRRPSDPPGPHAATGTASGRRFDYDANGNLESFDSALLEWDFEDRLARYSREGVQGEYLHDHQGRRVAKRVARGGAQQETLYVDEVFELRDGSPVKYALLDRRRIARIHGMLDPTRERVQRLVLAAGWNLVAAAVESSARLREAFGADAAVYQASGSGYAPLDMAATLPSGKALWVYAPAARRLVLRGRYPQQLEDAASPGPLHAWPRLEPFRPDQVLQGDPPLAVYDSASRRWLRRDPSLPAFLNDAPAELGAARAFWSPAEVRLKTSAAASHATVFYHHDHLDSTAAVTDASGRLLEESVHYPFGAVRHLHRPQRGVSGGSAHDFADKERDAESGLIAMGARTYLDLAGCFLSPDPRYTEAAALAWGSQADRQSFTAFLANPQMGNPYAYALRNPLKYVDPSGLDILVSKKLADNVVFREAVTLFRGTKEGQRILKSIESSGARVVFREGEYFGIDPKTGKSVEAGGWMGEESWGREWEGGINLHDLRNKSRSRAELVRLIAHVLYHELRHAEAGIDDWAKTLARKKSIWDHGERDKINAALDRYEDPSADPHEREFLREIGPRKDEKYELELGEVTLVKP